MAYFARTNGDAQPVFALDVQNGPVNPANTISGFPVQPQGPKLDFFRAVCNANCALQGGVNEYVSNVIQAIQQTATVAMYQVDDTALSFAVYPTGAFANAATFLSAANITQTGYQLNSATNAGFKLTT